MDTITVISEASLQGKNATCGVSIQSLITLALLGTGSNIRVVSEMFFNSMPQKPKLSKVDTHKVTSPSGAILNLIGQSDITFW